MDIKTPLASNFVLTFLKVALRSSNNFRTTIQSALCAILHLPLMFDRRLGWLLFRPSIFLAYVETVLTSLLIGQFPGNYTVYHKWEQEWHLSCCWNISFSAPTPNYMILTQLFIIRWHCTVHTCIYKRSIIYSFEDIFTCNFKQLPMKGQNDTIDSPS